VEGSLQDSITRLLLDWRGGNERALADLLPLVYDDLRRLARSQMRRERPEHSLQATALVHEAFVRLVKSDVDWKDRAHFLGVTTRLMRQVLIEHARARAAAKRGADPLRVTLTEALAPDRKVLDMIALDRALTELAENDPRQAQVVELRYIGGLKLREIAEAIDVSKATVERDLRHGRAWLKRALKRGP
jgi:RNA polymerase sigma factor (TIGR02999 family)